MITPEKIKAIKKQLRRGEPEGEIKEQMKVAGYSDDEIAQAFIPHPYDMRAWYLTFAILLLLLGVIVFINTSGFFCLPVVWGPVLLLPPGVSPSGKVETALNLAGF